MRIQREWNQIIKGLARAEDYFHSEEYLNFYLRQRPQKRKHLNGLQKRVLYTYQEATLTPLEDLVDELQENGARLAAAARDLDQRLASVNSVISNLKAIVSFVRAVRPFLLFL